MKRLCLSTIVMLLLSLAPACTGCNGRHSATQPEVNRIRILTLKGYSAMGMIRIIDSLSRYSRTSHPATQPLWQVEILPDPSKVRSQLIAGKADMAILPTTAAALLHNKGLPYRMVANPVQGTLYLCSEDSTIGDFADLKGKTVYLMAKGMTPDVLFRQVLRSHDMNPEKDLVLDYRFPTHIDLSQAAAAGRAPIAVLTEPYVSLVESLNPRLRRVKDLDTVWRRHEKCPVVETALVASADLLVKRPDLVAAFVKAYEQAQTWALDNIREAAALTVQYGIMPDSAAAVRALSHARMKFHTAQGAWRDSIMAYLKIFYDLNPDIIGGPPREDFLY